MPFKAARSGPFVYLHPVASGGYRWETDLVSPEYPDLPGPWLVQTSDPGAPRSLPLKKRGLYRRFARLKPNPEAVLDFARSFGHIGHPHVLMAEGGDQAVRGEWQETWYAEIRSLAWLIYLWERVNARDRAALSPYMRWTENGRLSSVSTRPETDASRRIVAEVVDRALSDLLGAAGESATSLSEELARRDPGLDWARELIARWEPYDPIQPARYYVHDAVNKRLQGHVSAAVLPYVKGELVNMPDCLISALYTQFAIELSGRPRPKILCARRGCGMYFRPRHGHQVYCSPNCSDLRYYHERKSRWAADANPDAS